MTVRLRALLVALVAAVVVGSVLVGRSLRDGGPSRSGVELTTADGFATFEHEYVIPAGTADRVTAGDRIEIVPRTLVAHVGEAIRIVNDDDEGHVVGVFYVGPGETLSQRFTAPGVLSGECTAHSDGEFTLRVEA